MAITKDDRQFAIEQAVKAGASGTMVVTIADHITKFVDEGTVPEKTSLKPVTAS